MSVCARKDQDLNPDWTQTLQHQWGFSRHLQGRVCGEGVGVVVGA